MSNDDLTDDDRDLRECFAALRRAEEALAPPIPMLSLTSREHGRRRISGKLAFAATCLTILIAAAVWLLPGARVAQQGSNPGREQAAASITTWKPATDFLLDTPGRELLEGVPEIGDGQVVVNAPGPGESHRPFKKQVLP